MVAKFASKGLFDLDDSSNEASESMSTITALRGVIAQLPWPCLLLDASLKVIAQSQGFLAALGNRSMLHLRLAQLASSEPRLEEIAERAMTQHTPHTLHDVHVFDTPLLADVSFHTLLAETTNENYVLLSLHLQKAELAQPHALLRQLGRAFAHEIANPLAGLKGVAQLLAKRAPELSEYTDILVQETERIHSLLARMRGQEIGPHRPVNVHQPLDNAAQLVGAQYPNLSLKRDYDPSLPLVSADTDALMQVALNLLLNAAQAGARCVLVQTRAEHQVPLGAKLVKTALRIDVCDDGTGVPEALRDSLFLPLVTGRSSGSGFGLASALAIVEEHGGAMRFSSQPGATCFSVYLPI
jgi:two-component system, NtrC family, nitrogen regulation sensor histidine kinase GlnL